VTAAIVRSNRRPGQWDGSPAAACQRKTDSDMFALLRRPRAYFDAGDETIVIA